MADAAAHIARAAVLLPPPPPAAATAAASQCCCHRPHPLCVQWPSLVRPLSPVISEMPGMVLERYNACQVRCTVDRRLPALVRLACLLLACLLLAWWCNFPPASFTPLLRSPPLTTSSTLHKFPYPCRLLHFAACSPTSSAPGPRSTTRSSCGALTSGALPACRLAGWPLSPCCRHVQCY